ncbi:MAG: hypothetical protein JWO44_1338 [Bacteroidetes bacterium]|nr:hypothetical protein [Bacteroidota bacterium]
MKAIDQNSAVISLEEALVPGPSMIDGRTEQDWLFFLSEFASLINFYDTDNTVKGSWEAFLLKDPVFLLAAISKTPFLKWHSLYVSVCLKVEQLFVTQNHPFSAPFNELFDQLTGVFVKIRQWTVYMQRSVDEYDLKTYVTGKVQSTFSTYFWALLALRQNLFFSQAIPGIAGVEFSPFESYDSLIWKQQGDKSPFWKVLQMNDPAHHPPTPQELYNAIISAGDKVFGFLQTIIRHAGSEFEKVKLAPSHYPDTTLLRTFVNLLNVQQVQLNGITEKHLAFYYKDVLQQKALPAVPDTAVLFAEPASKKDSFILPAGTLFSAGTDAQKKQVVFAAQGDVPLNPAVITGAYTLSALPFESSNPSLYLNQVPNAGMLEKNEKGSVSTWKTFGSLVPDNMVTLGFSIASPLLFLREGNRYIKFQLNFKDTVSQELLNGTNYFLSTQLAWHEVHPMFLSAPSANSVLFEIYVGADVPAIELFKNDPDNVSAQWPMLKITFSEFPNLASPPVLTNISIAVRAYDLKIFQLYNDYGALSSKNPFPPFGPAPEVKSNFIIGSNEIFSKPFDTLSIKLNWNNLPVNGFPEYYKRYRQYLQKRFQPATNPATDPATDSAATPAGSVFARVTQWLLRAFRKKQLSPLKESLAPGTATPPPSSAESFATNSFTVDFSILQQGTWNLLSMANQSGASTNQLFNTGAGPDVPLNFSTFVYVPVLPVNIIPDPSIQGSALKYTDASASGFMRMTLSGPPDGFGAGLYPKVVSAIALYNASIIMANGKKKIYSQAPLPFTPKLNSLTADYSASCSYDLSSPAEKGYSLQCYLYSPLTNYCAYDNTLVADESKASIRPLVGIIAQEGLSLFSPFSHNAALFLELDNLVPAAAINIYFELARKHTYSTSTGDGKKASDKKISYYCLCTYGWQELNLLSDGTNGLNRSGIITLNVPAQLSAVAFPLKGTEKKFWISAAVNEDPFVFADTAFVQTNGFSVQRSGTAFLSDPVTPVLPAGSITKTQSSVPQIASVIQPLPSKNGRAAEDPTRMNRRISNRLKTKDRAVSREDYFRLIRQEYPDIFYSKAIWNREEKQTEIYVVKKVESVDDPHAFLPLVTQAREEEIRKFLKERAPAFAAVSVSNFTLEYVKVTTTVVLNAGLEEKGMEKIINQALCVFLSPWIANSGWQMKIGGGISNAELGAFISTISGVAKVENVSFSTLLRDKISEITGWQAIYTGTLEMPSMKTALFVPFLNHTINFKPE